MAAWVDCSANFGGWAADMGPYIGPWPLLPPGETAGLSAPDGDEIDFYVMLPNPVDTTDPTIVRDGSYDTPYWDAYRYMTDSTPPTDFGYDGNSSGPSAPFPVPATPPSDVHLYVVAFISAPGPPTNPPEFYVPATYAAGGASAFETEMGHWSGDQAPFTQTEGVFATTGDSYYYRQDDTLDGDHDITAVVASQITSILAATKLPGGTSPTVSADKDNLSFHTTVSTAANLSIVAFDGTAKLNADFPPALDALVHDVDYTETPYIDAEGQPGKPYQYDAAPTFAWAAGATDGYSYEDSADTGSGEPLPLGSPYRVQWVSGAIVGTPWTISGNLIGDIAPAYGGIPPFGAPNYALDYSSVTALIFTLHYVDTFLYTGSIPGLTDFAMGIGHFGFTDDSTFSYSTPDIVIDRSTWQFWVPGAIVPTLAWHTIAGSWASISGAPMAIFTPGLGAVEYADGPA